VRLYGHTIRVRVGAPIPTAGLTAGDRDLLLIKTRRAILELHRCVGGIPTPAEPMIALPGKRGRG
jgi:1-acyl-sn-glycerol-3-phosphate acyltransferase